MQFEFSQESMCLNTWPALSPLPTVHAAMTAHEPDICVCIGSDMQDHFARIVPEARVEAKVAMFTDESAAELLGGGVNYVLDAIDNIDTKVTLPARTTHAACSGHKLALCLP